MEFFKRKYEIKCKQKHVSDSNVATLDRNFKRVRSNTQSMTFNKSSSFHDLFQKSHRDGRNTRFFK